jgi:hypothetical protein
MTDHRQKAEEHLEIAESLLGRIKHEKRMGREMDVKDASNAAEASLHVQLALYHQREADR